MRTNWLSSVSSRSLRQHDDLSRLVSLFEPEKTAASLSRRIVTDLLREELGFEGLIMTDDLDMGAILNEYGFEETIRRGQRRKRSRDDLPSRRRPLKKPAVS